MQSDGFKVIGEIGHVETIATGSGIRSLASLKKNHGFGRWRKRKGIATVELKDGSIRRAELHWYEAHGIGRKLMKIKRYLDG